MVHRSRPAALLLSIALLLAPSAPGGSWPGFRGPHTDGKVPEAYTRERPAEIGVDRASLQDYAGRYALGPEATVKVWEEKDRLRRTK